MEGSFTRDNCCLDENSIRSATGETLFFPFCSRFFLSRDVGTKARRGASPSRSSTLADVTGRRGGFKAVCFPPALPLPQPPSLLSLHLYSLSSRPGLVMLTPPHLDWHLLTSRLCVFSFCWPLLIILSRWPCPSILLAPLSDLTACPWTYMAICMLYHCSWLMNFVPLTHRAIYYAHYYCAWHVTPVT